MILEFIDTKVVNRPITSYEVDVAWLKCSLKRSLADVNTSVKDTDLLVAFSSISANLGNVGIFLL
jgi:hypothetical protein